MDRVALVTGGARGIGYGIATCLAEEGIQPVILDIHPAEAVTPALDALRRKGVNPLYCRGDVTSDADRKAALRSIRETYGALHILVNNAGVAPKVRADILEAGEESYEWVMKINLQGPYFLTQAVAIWMIEQQNDDDAFCCCVVNISSISATVASPSRGEYCLSKAGVSMATQLWATRLGEFSIPVYEIRPGVIMTDMTSVVKEKYDALIAEGLCLQKRWGYPEDIGKAVAMLTRGDLPYSTGQVIMIDGGLTMPRL